MKLAGDLSRDQKAQIVREMTETVVRVTGKPATSVLILIESEPHENWSRAGELLGN